MELVFSNIAHSGNKENEGNEGGKKKVADLSLQTKKCPLSEGRVRKMMVHPCYYLSLKELEVISIAEKSKKEPE